MADTQADEERVVYHTAATVRVAADDDMTPDELLALIKKKAPDPSIFEEDGVQPFMWQAEVSNSRLDSYYTRQDMTSLRNYAKQATEGVMFLDSHDKRQLGLGYSIRGVLAAPGVKLDERQPNDSDAATVSVEFFTIPGIQLGRASTDSFIASVRSGMVRDVSIGFMPERFECNLCKSDPFDWWSMECMHIPGLYYSADGKTIVKKRDEGAVQAFAWARDSRLLEVSAVYDGATPGAYIKKANWMAVAGEVDRAAATMIERQLRIHLPEQAMNIPVLKRELVGQDGKTTKLTLARGTAIIDGVEYREGMEVRELTQAPRFRRLSEERGEHDNPEPTAREQDGGGGEQQLTPPPENPNLKRDESPEGVADSSGGITSPAHAAPEDVRMSGLTDEQVQALQETATRDAGTVKAVRAALAAAGVKDAETADPADAIRTLHGTIADLTPRAQMGDEWRASVIASALDSGVRAMANDFKREDWEATFQAMPVKQIQLLAASWERQAPDLSGGRRTADVDTDPPAGGAKKRTDAIPDAQYTVNGRR